MKAVINDLRDNLGVVTGGAIAIGVIQVCTCSESIGTTVVIKLYVSGHDVSMVSKAGG